MSQVDVRVGRLPHLWTSCSSWGASAALKEGEATLATYPFEYVLPQPLRLSTFV